MSALDINNDNFNSEVLESSIPVLLDFWAPWCGPCKSLAPVLDEMATDKAGELKVVKVNVDNNQELAMKFAVRGIPTLLLFKDGEVLANKVGAAGREDLESWISANL